MWQFPSECIKLFELRAFCGCLRHRYIIIEQDPCVCLSQNGYGMTHESVQQNERSRSIGGPTSHTPGPHEMHPSGAFLNLKQSMSYIRYTQFSSLLMRMGAFPAWIGFIHSPLAVITFEHVESRSDISVLVVHWRPRRPTMALKRGCQCRWQHWCNHRGQCMTLLSQSLLLRGLLHCSRSSQSACRCEYKPTRGI